MDHTVNHQVLLNQYHSFLNICQSRGLSFEVPDDSTVDKMSDVDLAALVRSLRDITRTPGADR